MPVKVQSEIRDEFSLCPFGAAELEEKILIALEVNKFINVGSVEACLSSCSDRMLAQLLAEAGVRCYGAATFFEFALAHVQGSTT